VGPGAAFLFYPDGWPGSVIVHWLMFAVAAVVFTQPGSIGDGSSCDGSTAPIPRNGARTHCRAGWLRVRATSCHCTMMHDGT
jgi:hypothetical protein